MYILILLAVIGLGMNVTKNWAETRKALERPLSLREYLAAAPAQTSLAVLAAIGTFLALHEGTDWMNPVTALACGYMGHSIASGIARNVSVVK